jgi:hypothetical protein
VGWADLAAWQWRTTRSLRNLRGWLLEPEWHSDDSKLRVLSVTFLIGLSPAQNLADEGGTSGTRLPFSFSPSFSFSFPFPFFFFFFYFLPHLGKHEVPSMGRAREVIQWSREHQEGMELNEAVREQDVEKVKVRRPLEAVSSNEHGPSRGVSLGLGQWTLDAVVARPIRPYCVESTPLPSGAPQAILILPAGTPPCRSGRQVP